MIKFFCSKYVMSFTNDFLFSLFFRYVLMSTEEKTFKLINQLRSLNDNGNLCNLISKQLPF